MRNRLAEWLGVFVVLLAWGSDAPSMPTRLISARPIGRQIAALPRKASAKTDYRPLWSRQGGMGGLILAPHASYLSRPSYSVPEVPDLVTEWLQTTDRTHQSIETRLQEEAFGLISSQDARERHHLSGQQDQLFLAQQGWRLGRVFLRSLMVSQVRDSLKKAEKRSAPVAVVNQAQETIQSLASDGLSVQNESQWRFGSRADLIGQRGSVWMASPWVNGTVDFRLGFEDWGWALPGAVRTNERYQLSLQRELPLQLQSGLIYGGTTGTMTTSLSRPVLPHLNCTVENRQNIFQAQGEQLARFNYLLRF